MNRLYFGDNLDILRDHIASESIDLIYLDPPFNSNASYNVLFQEKSGERSAAQITAFDDTWHWGYESESAYQEVVKNGPRKLADLLQAMRAFLGQNDMLAYLVMMAQRMVELRRVMRPTASIYLHCDPTASHYLKLLMDSVWSAKSFRNELVWRRTNAKGLAFRGFPQNHDTILYYTSGEAFTWNRPYTELDPDYVDRFYRFLEPGTNRRYRLSDLTNPNRDRPNLTYEWHGHTRVWRWTRERMELADRQGLIHYSAKGFPSQKRYLDEMKGRAVDTIWDDISPIQAQSQERLGYPTQKPETLLERIIEASSNEGDIVLDPFCGCGTTVAVAERLKRNWIGIDITHLAIALMRRRLEDTFGSSLSPYEVIGQPQDLESARALAEQNRHQFEWWAVDLVDAHPAQDKRKGADSGIDGVMRFFDDRSGQAKLVVVQVKSGSVNASQIRDLKGVIEREKAAIGLFVTLEEPTKPMVQEAVAAGFYTSELFPDRQYPRIQILTIKDLLAGKRPASPSGSVATFKQAKRHRRGEGEQTSFT